MHKIASLLYAFLFSLTHQNRHQLPCITLELCTLHGLLGNMTRRSYVFNNPGSIKLAELLLECNDEFLFNEFLHLNLMWIKKRQSFLTLSVPSTNCCFLFFTLPSVVTIKKVSLLNTRSNAD